MKVEELKNFLRLRGLRVTGKKEELVARVFIAMENDVPVLKTAEEVQKEISEEYAKKLTVTDGVIIPDPFSLKTGWLDEEAAVRYWPVTLYPNIFAFLAFHPNELSSQDLSDYKTSKAYGYYARGWLSKLDFHHINGDHKFCILKGTCRPSQRINDTSHKFWLCLSKESGKIICTHCTCMAGLSQTCNHVAAALFRIEAASRLGLNNPSCTSKACEWLPNNKTVQPVKIKDLDLNRDGFGKRGMTVKTKLNSSPKKKFDPISESDYSLSLDETANALRNVCKESDSIIFCAMPKAPTQVSEDESIDVESLNDLIILSNSVDEFMERLKAMSKETIIEVEEMTRGQSENPQWFAFRKHVITASKAHAVMTRCNSLKKKSLSLNAAEPIFQKVSGTANLNPDLPALRYGRAMEEEAVNCFKQLFSETHKNVKIFECGLYLSNDAPYIGGSPDRIVECDCCRKSCLEVKCPFSVRHTTPVDDSVNLPYLKKENGEHKLNQQHSYFTQCQVQMAVTEIPVSDFFIWTAHGYFIEKIKFCSSKWTEVKDILHDFYVKMYLPLLFDNKE